MKKLAKHLTLLLVTMLLAVIGTSCNDDNGGDQPQYYNAFMIIRSDGVNVWFENGNGKYEVRNAPASLELIKKDGRRALVYYYEEKTAPAPGYDKVIGLMALQFCTTGNLVEVSDLSTLDSYGTASISFDNRSYNFCDGWFDILIDYYQYLEAEHTFSLCIVPNELVPSEVPLPSGYVYMELRHYCDKTGTKLEKIRDIASFKLPEEYDPTVNPSVKGYYIRLIDEMGGSSYANLEFKKQ